MSDTPWVVPKPNLERNTFKLIMLALKCDDCWGTGSWLGKHPGPCKSCTGSGLSRDRTAEVVEDSHWAGAQAGWEDLSDRDAYTLGLYWAIPNDEAWLRLLDELRQDIVDQTHPNYLLDPFNG